MRFCDHPLVSFWVTRPLICLFFENLKKVNYLEVPKIKLSFMVAIYSQPYLTNKYCKCKSYANSAINFIGRSPDTPADFLFFDFIVFSTLEAVGGILREHNIPCSLLLFIQLANTGVVVCNFLCLVLV